MFFKGQQFIYGGAALLAAPEMGDYGGILVIPIFSVCKAYATP